MFCYCTCGALFFFFGGWWLFLSSADGYVNFYAKECDTVTHPSLQDSHSKCIIEYLGLFFFTYRYLNLRLSLLCQPLWYVAMYGVYGGRDISVALLLYVPPEMRPAVMVYMTVLVISVRILHGQCYYEIDSLFFWLCSATVLNPGQ